jgi:glycine reductase
MTMLGKQIGANRIVPGAKIAHVCGDPTLPVEEDVTLRNNIVERALEAVQTEVTGPTVFELNVKYTAG